MEEKTGDQFNPDWRSPPGDTIKDLQQEKGISDEALAEMLGLNDPLLQSLLRGNMRMYYGLAKRLTQHLGGSVDFWIKREHHYRKPKVVNTTREEHG